MPSEFSRKLITWAKLHMDDPLSSYYLTCFKEAVARRKAEKKRWSQIARALLIISEGESVDTPSPNPIKEVPKVGVEI